MSNVRVGFVCVACCVAGLMVGLAKQNQRPALSEYAQQRLLLASHAVQMDFGGGIFQRPQNPAPFAETRLAFLELLGLPASTPVQSTMPGKYVGSNTVKLEAYMIGKSIVAGLGGDEKESMRLLDVELQRYKLRSDDEFLAAMLLHGEMDVVTSVVKERLANLPEEAKQALAMRLLRRMEDYGALVAP